MVLMEPVLTDTALNHLSLVFPIWVRIWSVTGTVQALVVLTVRIVMIFGVFVWNKLTRDTAKL